MEKEEPARQEGVEQCPGDIIKKILGELEPRRERELEEGAKTDQKLEVLNGLNLQTVSIIF